MDNQTLVHQIKRETAKKIVQKYFKNDYGEPFLLTDSQADIFNIIWLKEHNRNQVISSTQYGKSDVTSMAVILRSIVFKESWAIISGSTDKSMIIMGKVIQHTFDDEKFYRELELDPNMKLDRLKRERSKDKITWKAGGGIRIFTANTRNRQQVKEALTGFGSPNIIEDEASLVPNDVQAMVLRMLGGHRENFLLKIGNPFYRNHFYRTWNSDKYHKVFIDYNIALAEGRYTLDFIDEMRDQPFFSVLYECKFPDNDLILAGGYQALVSEALLESAFISEEEFEKLCTKEITIKNDDGSTYTRMVPQGQPRLGGDFAGGGNDRSAFTIRWDNVLKLISTNKIADTMQQVPIIEDLIKEWGIEPENVSLDYGGLGQGVGDRLHEKEIFTNNVMFGSSAPEYEKEKYKNMRAYMYYQLRLFLEHGGKIVKNDSFYELLVVNYKTDSERKFQIQPKEELKKLLKDAGLEVTSPDVPDSAALCFADNSSIVTEDDIAFI